MGLTDRDPQRACWTDPSRSIVAGAKVSLQDAATRVEQVALTNSAVFQSRIDPEPTSPR